MTTKAEIKQQVVNDLRVVDPQKIILFGSLRKGRYVEGESDIDLLVIQNTDRRLVDRYAQARLALKLNHPFDIFVLTEEELEEKLATSFFFREIVSEGEVLYEQH